MKIHIVGGGPAGLYFASLMKKAWPQTHHGLRAQPAGDTFGFGVVFSTETLDTFETLRPGELPRHRRSFRLLGRYRDPFPRDRSPHRRQRVLRLLARYALKILGRRARSLGVDVKYQTEVSPTEIQQFSMPISSWPRTASILVFARPFRSFQPSVDLGPNIFSWMGSTRPFDAFTSSSARPSTASSSRHCYQYEPRCSTWIIETDRRPSRAPASTRSTRRPRRVLLEDLFAQELKGHRLITNRSIWRNFPTVRCERWVADNVVLIGDAKATAHFSIGSGTKLAMEDGIALFEAFRSTGGRDVARGTWTFRSTAARGGREDAAFR